MGEPGRKPSEYGREPTRTTGSGKGTRATLGRGERSSSAPTLMSVIPAEENCRLFVLAVCNTKTNRVADLLTR